jgi:hypothetical protein
MEVIPLVRQKVTHISANSLPPSSGPKYYASNQQNDSRGRWFSYRPERNVGRFGRGNEKLKNLYSPNIRVVNSRRVKWADHVGRMW